MRRFSSGLAVTALLISGLFLTQANVLAAVITSPEVTYKTDALTLNSCYGSSLKYHVLYPSVTGSYPVVFALEGTGFHGAAACLPNGKANYTMFDGSGSLAAWASQNLVIVNVEYQGTDNGLYGNATYPGPGLWGTVADATTETDIKAAIRFFYANNPAQYNANTTKPFVIYGQSSGGHSAYMVANTGVTGTGVPAIAGAIGWSGLPYVAESPASCLPNCMNPRTIFDAYMKTTAGTDTENFGDAFHRISSSAKPQYGANSAGEFMNPQGVQDYINTLTSTGISTCYLRILNSSIHATYGGYTFTGVSPEYTNPSATVGMTVQQDSINYAKLLAG